MTLLEHLLSAQRIFKDAGFDDPKLEARVLMSHAAGLSRAQLILHEMEELEADKAAYFEEMVTQRAAGVPAAYLTSHREFWSLDLKVTFDTLIPRPDTETLVEEALKLEFKSAADLGTGTGAIILALKKERPQALCTAVEINPKTLEVAAENARANGLEVEFCSGSWFEPLKGRIFDLIVSNPPYIRAADPHLQLNGLNFEPQGALVSGEDGLDDLRIIVGNAPNYLNKGGHLLVEHGYDQGTAVRELFSKAGFAGIKTVKDLGGNDRVTLGTKP